MSKSRAKKIKLLILDVDGVMTDGKMFFIPAPPELKPPAGKRGAKQGDAGDPGAWTSSMFEIKGFHAHDGIAMSLSRLGGLKTAVITKRVSETVRVRCRDLHIDYVYQGISDKLAVLQEILTKEKLKSKQAAYVGDDVVDLLAMRACGLAIATANARDSVKKAAHFVTEHPGGQGAVRDAVEYILKSQGTLDHVIDTYTSQRKTSEASPEA